MKHRSTKTAKPVLQCLKWVCKKIEAVCRSVWKWWKKPRKLELGLDWETEEVRILKRIADGREEIFVVVIKKYIRRRLVLELGFYLALIIAMK
jgi:hypothetical protein